MNYSKRMSKKVLYKRIRLLIATGVVVGGLIGGFIGTTATRAAQALQIKKNAEVYGVSIGKHSKDLTWYGTPSDAFVPLDVDMDENLQRYVFDLCSAYNLDFCFCMAVMKHESEFQSDIISDTKDYGLMQINEVNHKWLSDELGITDFLNPKQNIKAGVYVLRQLFEKYEDPAMVLMAYNLGEGGAMNMWEEDIYSTNYSDEILDIASEYQDQYERKVTEDD